MADSHQGLREIAGFDRDGNNGHSRGVIRLIPTIRPSAHDALTGPVRNKHGGEK